MTMRTILLFVASTGTALAAGGGDGGFPAKELLFHAINLAIVIGILVKFAGPKIKDALANRSTQTRRELQEAAEARQAAQARFEELEGRLSGFEQELASMRQAAEADVQREVDSIDQRGDRDARLIALSAERSIRDETQRARQQLREDAVNLAVKVATDAVERDIGDGDHQRLAGEFLGAVNSESEVANG